jgi:hypothetical protein
VSVHYGGKDPISRKKLEKGDARFNIEKEILGFIINGADWTIRLSVDKAQAIADEIAKILRKTHVPLKRFRSLLGRLQHAAWIVPAAKGLFSPLNKATQGDPSEVGVGKRSEARAALLDLRHLVLTLASHPTHVSELGEYEPDIAGTCDASAAGAGGIWVGYGIQPTVWRVKWPPDVVQAYQTGKLTNSDLEIAASVLLQYLVAQQLCPMERCHTAIWSDNTPATSWSTKMADKASSPIAGQLLRALAMWQRTTSGAVPTVTHYAGAQNLLADTASQSFARFHPVQKRHPISNRIQFRFLSFPVCTDAIVAARRPDSGEWAQVAHATVDAAARATHWRNWCAWCARFAFDHFLLGTPREQHTHVFMAFATRVRSGAFGHGKEQVGCQSVATALHHVSQAFVLAS